MTAIPAMIRAVIRHTALALIARKRSVKIAARLGKIAHAGSAKIVTNLRMRVHAKNAMNVAAYCTMRVSFPASVIGVKPADVCVVVVNAHQ